jgi:hypothetical protein
MRKLLFRLIVPAAVGYLIRRIQGRNPDPAGVSTAHPERTVRRMERVAGQPVRP